MKKENLKKAAKLRILGKTLQKNGGKTFDSKVKWVKQHMPEVTDPESFVAAALRAVGEL